MNNEKEHVIQLPDDGIINTSWAMEQLERASMWSSFELHANKGRVFFMLKTSLTITAYEQTVNELDYSMEAASAYLRFLEKLPVLEAIREKYFSALSLSASELIPNDVEDAFALVDICLSRCGKPTAKNLEKALALSGKSPKKLTDSALTIEKLKKTALNEWLLGTYALSEDDILQASSIDNTGKNDYLDKMLQAYSLLEDWKTFYNIIADPVLKSDNTKALRFLSDINDASASIKDFLKSEKAYNDLTAYKATFDNEIYPLLQHSKESKDG